MFWGFPVSGATLPTLAAVASAIRYGTGGSRPGERARGDHRRGTDDRHARAVDAEGRHAPEPESDVGGHEGSDRDRPTPLAAGHTRSIHARVRRGLLKPFSGPWRRAWRI